MTPPNVPDTLRHARGRAIGHRPAPHETRLSIVMPVFNEGAFIGEAIREVLRVEYPCPVELIVVDDGSTDATPLELALIDDPRVRVHRQPTNLGKGAAVRAGAQLATGTHILPFDADMEYSPADIPRLLGPVMAGRYDVVYGTRLFGSNTVYHSYRYAAANRAMTLAANILYDACLSDLHTCLKLVPLDLFRSLPLRESGFGLDTEVTASLLRIGVRPFEVPVSYHSRTHDEGKKINWRDGVACLHILGRVRFSRHLEGRVAPRPRRVATTHPHPHAHAPVPAPAAADATEGS